MIDQLRVEWSVNAQYGYGWAVPFLCGYLAWCRWREGLPSNGNLGSVGMGGSLWVRRVAFGVCAGLYLPTRLVQEANPEWRLVSWALAVEVVGLTWLILRGWQGVGETEGAAGCRPTGRQDACRYEEGSRRDAWPTLGRVACGFPLWFFLVAVPWPTVIEGPLTQVLGRADAAVAVEVLNLAGVPSLQHGNLIEVGSGLVGIDEACSGIRSLQATLMIALFFGELYRLRLPGRALCVAAGVGLALVFNVGRTTALTWVAAREGAAGMEAWHDPAGVSILVGCFVSLWLIARSCATRCKLKVEGRGLKNQPLNLQLSTCNFQLSGLGLVAWLLAVEVGTEGWYRAHERGLALPVRWRIEAPRDKPGYRKVAMSEKARQFLRYDEAFNARWEAEPGVELQAIFLRWKPGRIAVHLARSHTPRTCLTAAGHELKGEPAARRISMCELRLPFERYRFEEGMGPVFVFYCLWEDRAPGAGFEPMGLTWGNRLRPVAAGRRNCGQRSLEVAVRGAEGGEQAEGVLTRELQGTLRIEN